MESVAQGKKVILCVTGSPQVEENVYGDDGLLSGTREGLIVADCTTAEPHSTLKIAADVKARGDYPVHFAFTMLGFGNYR